MIAMNRFVAFQPSATPAKPIKRMPVHWLARCGMSLAVAALLISGPLETAARAQWYAYGDFNGWTSFDPLLHVADDYYTGTITGLGSNFDFNYKIGTDVAFLVPSTDGRVRSNSNGEIQFNFWDNTSWNDGWEPSNARRVGYVDHGDYDWEVMGSFNDWSAPLTLIDQGNGLHSGTFALPAGSHEFKFRQQADWATSIGADFGNGAANNSFAVLSNGDEWTFELDLPNGRWRAVTDAPPLPPTDLNGSRVDKPYGEPVAVQTINTSFGDNNSALAQKGSELDAAYARFEDGKLHLLLTGNLEDNFSKLVLFFDSKPGGQNAIDTDTDNGGTNPVTDPSPFPSDPSMFAKMGGTFWDSAQATFDSDFAADYALVLRHGFDGAQNRFDVDYAILGGGVGASSQYLNVFNPTLASGGVTAGGPGFANSQPIEIGFNNGNDAGVEAGAGPADQVAAAEVETGIEIAISLADLGMPQNGDEIRVTAFITNSTHDFVSNQFLGGLPEFQDSLGSDGTGWYLPSHTSFDLNNYAGNQYFSIIVTEPLQGDFNLDGTVDAADYVLWRKGANGETTPENYNLWYANFGRFDGGSGGNANIPEPNSVVLTTLLLSMLAVRSWRSGNLT